MLQAFKGERRERERAPTRATGVGSNIILISVIKWTTQDACQANEPIGGGKSQEQSYGGVIVVRGSGCPLARKWTRLSTL